MKSSENRKFEEAWKEAFTDAEGNVSDSVWNNIDSQLARAESGEMKKRVVFYKWLAAASVVFAMVVGGGVVFLGERAVDNGQLTINKQKIEIGSPDSLGQDADIYRQRKQSSFAKATEDKLAVGSGGEVNSSGVAVDNQEKVENEQLVVGKDVEKGNGQLTIDKEREEVVNRQPSSAKATEDKLAVGSVRETDSSRVIVNSEIGKVDNEQKAVSSIGKIDKGQLAVDNEVGKVGNEQKAVGKNGEVDKGQPSFAKASEDKLAVSSDKTKTTNGIQQTTNLTEQPSEAVIAKTEEPSNKEIKSPEVKSMNEPTGSSQTGVAAVIPTETILKETDTVAIIESPIKIAKVEEPKTDEEKKIVKKDAEENWWAAVSGSAGSYNPNGTTSGGSFTSPSFQNNSTGSSQAVGTAYSYGVNVGKRIAPRWVLISGVGFLSQSINYPSNQAVFNASQAQAFSADASKLSTSNGTTAAPINSYELNSINEFVTVPLQAGYLIVNKKVGVQLNAGVASDIFVRNSLVDPTSRLSTNTQSAGENSTYRTFNWTGLVGTELSYKISNHYRISVIPGMRYSFNSILKPTVGSTITPLIWDVGFRFKYIF